MALPRKRQGGFFSKRNFMKKKSIRLKKLTLSKATIAQLNKQQQEVVAGGAQSVDGPFCNSANCVSYDPQPGCESRPRPGYQCV